MFLGFESLVTALMETYLAYYFIIYTDRRIDYALLVSVPVITLTTECIVILY